MTATALRPVGEDDLPALERFLTDPSALGDFEWHGWRDPNVWRRRWTQNGLLGEDAGQLMVVDGDDRLGLVSWTKTTTSQISFCWRTGIVLFPSARGQGHGTRAQRLLVGELFAHTQAARIESVTEAGNIAEQRALEKAGFAREGRMRDYTFRDGEWRDAILYATIRRDWADER